MDNSTLDNVMMENWLVWSNEHAGWWGPARRGYVTDRKLAGRYTFTEAEDIVRMANRHGLNHPVPSEAMVPEDLP